MPFTALLLEGSHKTKLVEEILQCPLCAYTLVPEDKEFAALLYEAKRALEAPSAATGLAGAEGSEFRAHLAKFGNLRKQVGALLLSLIYASKKEDGIRTFNAGQNLLKVRLFLHSTEAAELATAAAQGPLWLWRHLARTLNEAVECLSQAVECGRKPLPPPSGLMEKFGRALTRQNTIADKRLQSDLHDALAKFKEWQSKMHGLMKEMEKD
jgi:hypothetical protein